MMLSTFWSKRLILASASPRRKELLEKLKLGFEVIPADIDECINPEHGLEAEIIRVAREKAWAIACGEQDVVLAADTVVVYRDRVLTKPVSRSEALEMLTLLSGNVHQVLTAYAIRSGGQDTGVERCVKTDVEFFDLTPELLNWYLDQNEYQDKAGAYAIQGFGALLVKRITGSYSNVVGLPVEWVWRDLLK